MTSIGFEIGVFVVLGVKIGTQVVVVLIKEVSLANAYPKEGGLLGKQTVNLCVTVGIDLRMTIRITR